MNWRPPNDSLRFIHAYMANTGWQSHAARCYPRRQRNTFQIMRGPNISRALGGWQAVKVTAGRSSLPDLKAHLLRVLGLTRRGRQNSRRFFFSMPLSKGIFSQYDTLQDRQQQRRFWFLRLGALSFRLMSRSASTCGLTT